jgi:hypothetical protein
VPSESLAEDEWGGIPIGRGMASGEAVTGVAAVAVYGEFLSRY